MTDIYYPHDSLPMPLQEGYGFQPVSPLKRTQFTTGRARQRRAYRCEQYAAYHPR